MKKIIIILASVCVFFLFLTAGCDRKNLSGNVVGFDSIHVEETYCLFNDTANPGCNIQISFTYPDSADGEVLDFLQSIFTRKTLGDSFQNLNPQEAVETYKQQYIQAFKCFETPEEFKTIFGDTLTDNGETGYTKGDGFFYYILLDDKVVYNRDGFISFTVKSTNYEGGAHSSQNIFGYVIDLKNKRLIQEDDFAELNYKQNIAPVLAAKIAEINGLKSVAELENIGYFDVKDIVPNNNFTIDDKGITYYFNENEIAGTMVGLMQVFIPYEEINIYMKKDGPVASLTH